MTKEELIAFEQEIKKLFLNKKIRCPIHLSGGNEEPLIEIFKQVKPSDWCLSTHRSHYHALLKGIPPWWLKQEILAGRSMQIMSAEHRFLSSSIVGGICPIAVGLAMAIKRRGGKRRVFAFIGDMAGESGIFHESVKYARGHDLPVIFVIEDNHFSTDTPTAKVWAKRESATKEGEVAIIESWLNGAVFRYSYTRVFPHVGCGQFVRF